LLLQAASNPTLLCEYSQEFEIPPLPTDETSEAFQYLQINLADNNILNFSAREGKERTYLSIDLEKGGFEICNYSGEHKGELFNDVTKTSGDLRTHDIKVKS